MIFDVALVLSALLCSIVSGLLFSYAILVMPGIKSFDDKNFIKTLSDVSYNIFSNFGYVVGRIYPKGVLYRNYRFYEENFLYGNFVATPKEKFDIIDCLTL